MLDSVQPPFDRGIDDVLDGLSQRQKTLPAKFLYDAEGCRLFNAITELPEYYPTRTERDLLARVIPQLPKRPGSALVEYGGCDETKALPLIDHLGSNLYVPIDVAAPALRALERRLRQSRPGLQVLPLVADFLQAFALPGPAACVERVGFFPGSTIGNLDPAEAQRFLTQARHDLGPDALFLIGVDLRKDAAILVPAYDDAQGVTAAFNRNVLAHLNRVAGADFDIDGYAHRAVWNVPQSRIEMHLVSLRPQVVTIAGRPVTLADGETIHTESSYKHTVAGFIELAAPAGWVSRSVWTDDAALFSVHLLAATERVV